MSALVVVVLLSFLSLSVPTFTAAFHTNVTLLLNDCCGPNQAYFLHTLTLDSTTSVNATITTADPHSTVLYTQHWNDPDVDNVDGMTADPTLTNPTFLTVHGDYTLVQYVQSPLNATMATARSIHPNPAPHLSNMMPYPQADLPGVGLYYVEQHFLYYVDLLSAYYAIAYINVEGPTKTDFVFMVFSNPDQYFGGVTAARPTYTDVRTVPTNSFIWGLSGSKVAIDQAQALVYVNIIFWQPDEPEYKRGWLWTYDARKNAVIHETYYPTNTSTYSDYKTELVWSDKRQQLYGTTFTGDLMLDKIDPVGGSVVRIAQHSNVVMDNYDACHALDDTSGWWYFATNDPFIVPPKLGLVWIIYSINVDTGVMGPVNTLNVPYIVFGLSLIPPPTLMAPTAQALTDGQVAARETAAEMQREKRLMQARKGSRRVSVPAVARQ